MHEVQSVMDGCTYQSPPPESVLAELALLPAAAEAKVGAMVSMGEAAFEQSVRCRGQGSFGLMKAGGAPGSGAGATAARGGELAAGLALENKKLGMVHTGCGTGK